MDIEEIKVLAEPISKKLREQANPYYFIIVGQDSVQVVCSEQKAPIGSDEVEKFIEGFMNS